MPKILSVSTKPRGFYHSTYHQKRINQSTTTSSVSSWLEPSKPPASPREARLHESSSPPRPLANPPPTPEASRSPTVTVPEPLPFAKSGAIRSRLNSCFARNPFAPRPRDRPRFQIRFKVPVNSHACQPGGGRGLSRWTLRGHQHLRHPRQARDDHAEGYSAGPPHPW